MGEMQKWIKKNKYLWMWPESDAATTALWGFFAMYDSLSKYWHS